MRWVWLVATSASLLAGCDYILSLDKVGPYTPPDAEIDAPIQIGWKATTTGASHSCGIRADDTLWCWGGNARYQVGIASTSGVVSAPTQLGALPFAQVSSSRNHTCAVTLTGDLYCWGANDNAQLGTGNATYAPAPVRIGGTWKQVSAATYHTCAIRSDETLWCWGDNYYGQLGTGIKTQNEPLPVQVGTDHWLDVDGGDYQSCGVQTDNSLWCWGDNNYGALGNGTYDHAAAPVAALGEAWVDVSVGRHVACGRTTTGALRCWGNGYSGALGAGMQLQSTPSPVAVLIEGIEYEDWVQLSIEDETGCAIRNDGSMWCWGLGSHSQLGTDVASGKSYVPIQVSGGGTSWRRVATTGDHTCAIDVDNHLWCWGASSQAQLGDPSTAHSLPTQLPGMYAKISTGGNVTCGLQSGTFAPVCAGENSYGTVGDGTNVDRQTMTPLMTVAGAWSTISAGSSASCGVSSTPTVVTRCWGYNYSGAVGDGTMTTRLVPTTLYAGGYVDTVSNWDHTCGLNGNSIFCWGLNGSGQVGDGTMTTRLTPVGVVGTGKSIVAGGVHTCVINTLQAAYCWGSNIFGQLGIGTSAQYALSPNAVDSSLTGPIAQIDAGTYHTCAVANDNKLYCWGYNYNGQLGLGDQYSRGAPVRVGNGLWRMVATGNNHTCAIAMDTSLYCWGRNARGQLGVGTFDDLFVPIRVGDESGWTDVEAGNDHTCAQKAGGETWCWGSNDHGQIPDGSAWHGTPVMVP